MPTKRPMLTHMGDISSISLNLCFFPFPSVHFMRVSAVRLASLSVYSHNRQYSELPLIWTPEMWPPLYSDQYGKSRNTFCRTNWPLKCGHPSNQTTFPGPNSGRIRGSPLNTYVYCREINKPLLIWTLALIWNLTDPSAHNYSEQLLKCISQKMEECFIKIQKSK